MEKLKTILVIVAIFIGLPLLIVWLNDKIFHRIPSKAKWDEYSRQFEERLLNPDFAGVEAILGCTLPEEVRRLYSDKNEILRGDFEVIIKPANDSNGVCTVAYYTPADKEAVADYWEDCKKYFSFANDGCGNDYLIDPTVPKSKVWFHDHETGEFNDLGVTFEEFLSAPRKKTV
jgi:SMI1 / KNR4 family (SUKH-1)